MLVELPIEGMPRDVRIAKAMLEYLAEPDTRGEALRIAFTMYEEDCEVMVELCKNAGWTNQEAMENGEPARWFAYELHYKYRARFNPAAWPLYTPEWTPAEEMAFLLRRVFDYEAKPAAVAA